MIFTEKTRQEILGTLVLILGVACVLVFFILESPLDPEIFQILGSTLMLLIVLAGFEGIVLLIHNKNNLNNENNNFDPPV